MQHPLVEKNFRPLTSLLNSGYTASVEIGDLVQDKQVWPEQVLRVTVTLPDGDVKWKLFRGSKSRSQANHWLDEITAGAIQAI